MARRLATGVIAALVLVGTAGCGNVIPVPVPVSPTEAGFARAPRPEPPPASVTHIQEAAGVCSHSDLVGVAVFQGHYNASDGRHYHGWLPPMGEVFWVEC